MTFNGRRIFLFAMAICASAAITLADRAESTPQDVFDAMRGSFQPAKAKGVHVRYQWDLSGPHGGESVRLDCSSRKKSKFRRMVQPPAAMIFNGLKPQ